MTSVPDATELRPCAVRKAPADLCRCGHSRNQHERYGLGRCLLGGCTCTNLRAPAPEQLGPLMTYGGTTVPYDVRRGR